MAAKPESTYDSYGDDDRRRGNSSESDRRDSDSRDDSEDEDDNSRLSSRSPPRDTRQNVKNTYNAKNSSKIAAQNTSNA